MKEGKRRIEAKETGRDSKELSRVSAGKPQELKMDLLGDIGATDQLTAGKAECLAELLVSFFENCCRLSGGSAHLA